MPDLPPPATNPWFHTTAQRLNGTRVVVTGATGTVGRLVVDALQYMAREADVDIEIVATGRRPQSSSSFVDWVEWDVLRSAPPELLVSQDERPTSLLVHCAANTTSRDMADRPVDVFTLLVEGTRNTLDFARSTDAATTVLFSSVEAYGTFPPRSDTCAAERISEDHQGFLDLGSPRSSYPLGKRCTEFLAAAYRHTYDLNVVSLRSGQLIGPGITRNDSRAPALFLRQALAGKPIRLATDGAAALNYCDPRDLLNALWLVATRTSPHHVFTVVNDEHQDTILDLARRIAALSRDVEVTAGPSDRPSHVPFPPTSTAWFSSERLRTLGWHPEHDLDESIRDMAISWDAVVATPQQDR